jgi:dTDP-glucose 4,6-dehydratase
MTVHGTGGSERDFTYVTDLARAIALVIEAREDLVVGEVFNVGNDRATSVLDIASLIKKILPPRLETKPTFTNYTLNIGDRPGQVFGWKPEITLEKGIEMTIDWYLANRAWWEPKIWMRHVEIATPEGKKELH